MALNGHIHLMKSVHSKFRDLDLNQKDSEGTTLFLLAIKNKRKDFIKYLMSLDTVDFTLGSQRYGYPLHNAIRTYDFRLAIQLIMRINQSQGHFFSSGGSSHMSLCKPCEADGFNALHHLFMQF
jgi:hypothetical protein